MWGPRFSAPKFSVEDASIRKEGGVAAAAAAVVAVVEVRMKTIVIDLSCLVVGAVDEWVVDIQQRLASLVSVSREAAAEDDYETFPN